MEFTNAKIQLTIDIFNFNLDEEIYKDIVSIDDFSQMLGQMTLHTIITLNNNGNLPETDDGHHIGVKNDVIDPGEQEHKDKV